MKTLYTAVATATSGREGKATSNDNNLDVNLAIPKELGGAGGNGTNPEQLFAAGYAACFSSALSMIARQQKVTTGSFTITGHVALGQDDNKTFGLAVELEGTFLELDKAKAEELMHAAHEVCPYSNATRNNIPVTLTVKEG